jgi:poly(hydroxyalkanoate) granule-associated protein
MGKTNPAGLLMDNQVARLVKDSAHQVWLAGLGAYARAEKQGSRLFDNLVTLGERIESGARARVDTRIRAAESRAQNARDTAAEAWDRLEQLFQQRVARVLNNLQIPTARDVHELNRRVEELSRAVEHLTKEASSASQAGKPARAGATTKRKAAAKKAGAPRRGTRKPSGRRKAAAPGAG